MTLINKTNVVPVQPSPNSAAVSLATPFSSGPHLKYLDGLRGLSALYVVVSHVHQILGDPGSQYVPRIWQAATAVFNYGYYAVAIFIVLSGYCLMLPVVKSADQQLRGGFYDYILRRAKRILPPYYAAFAFSILLALVARSFLHAAPVQRDIHAVLATLTPACVAAHLLLAHNVRPEWSNSIDPPLWSVATEWQIYFLFPTVLLPVWRKFGAGAAIAAGFAIGLIPYILPGQYWHHASPFYLGLFAFGMVGAVIGFSRSPVQSARRARTPWALLSLVCWALWLVIGLRLKGSSPLLMILSALAGAGATCLIVYCSRYLTSDRSTPMPLAVRLLDAPFAVGLGRFSYSLYLTHSPVLWAACLLLMNMHLSFSLRYTLLMLAGVPLAVVTAYAFYLVFEKPFLARPVVLKSS